MIFSLCFITLLHAQPSPQFVYSQIEDIYHPTLEDYEFVQSFLNSSEDGIIASVGDEWVDRNLRKLQIVGRHPNYLQSGVISVNCDPSEKENCLILYSTFNQNYSKNLRRLIRHTMNSDFRGDILYHIGGWPNTEAGDLVLAHVPYAFKVSAFREAKRLGYKRAFWLDCPAIPIISLNDVYKYIEEKGYFIIANAHNVGPYTNARSAAAFGLTLEETYQIPSCQAGMVGIDFTKENTAKLVDLWYKAAQDPDAFYSLRPEQNALSIILYQQGLQDFIADELRPVYFHWIR